MAGPYRGEARFRVRYDEPMLQDAVRSFVFRRLLREQPFFWTVELVMLGLLLYRLAQGQEGWVNYLLLCAVALPPLLALAIWWAHHSRTLGQLRALSRPEAEVLVDEHGWTFASDLGRASLPWGRLTAVWRRPGYWMLFWGPAEFNTLPDAPVPDDLRAALARLAR